MIQHTTPVRVRFKDTDAMGVVYHGNYFTWFEVGRVRLLDQIGLPYRSLTEQGYHLPVLEANARYHSPAKFDDEVLVTAIIKDLPRVRMRIDYELKRDDTLLVTGFTQHAFVGNDGQPVKPPASFSEAMRTGFSKA